MTQLIGAHLSVAGGLYKAMEQAEALGLEGVVLHPGARVGQEPEAAMAHCIQSLNAALQATAGIACLGVIHVNDSQKGLGSRVDRHASLGDGMIGVEAFRLLMRDPRLTDIPKIIETPKGDGDEQDGINLALLR